MHKIKSFSLGMLAYTLSKIIFLSLRIRVKQHPNYDKKCPYLFAFWHGKQFLPVMQLVKHTTPKIALVSPSKDGDILSWWLKLLNYDVLRGSARDKNIQCTIQMLRKLKQGYSLGFGVDGPIGPIHIAKPGMGFLAQKSALLIVPLGSYLQRKWTFNKAWDKYQLPMPFSKVFYYIGEPIKVPLSLKPEEFSSQLTNTLIEAEQKAKALSCKN